jgi:hypothetical protein
MIHFKKETRLNTNPFLSEDIKLKRIIIATMISNIFILLDLKKFIKLSILKWFNNCN